MSNDSLVSTGGADTDSYLAHDTRKAKVDPSKSVRELMTNARGSRIPTPVDVEEQPAPVPVIPPEVVEENKRRVQAAASNTIYDEWVDPKTGATMRAYREDRVVRSGDGRIDSLRTDRGKGTRDSLDMLSKEGSKVSVDKLLPGAKRDASGRFTKGGK
jgi:hypothetical protein